MLVGVAVIYGGNYLVANQAMQEHVPPRAFILFRVAGAALLFWLIKPRSGKQRIGQLSLAEKKRLFICALFGVCTNMLFFFEGLKITTPVNASIMMVSGPIAILVAGAILLKERISSWQLGGILMGAIGAVVLIVGSNDGALSSLLGSQVALGNIFVLINASSYAIYLVLVGPLMKKYGALFVIKWVFTVGTFLVLPFGGPQLADIHLAHWNATVYWQVAYVVFATTFLTYLGNLLALKYVKPTTVGAYIYLQPIVASLLSYVVLGEVWTPQMALGAAAIFSGVYFVSFYKPRRAKAGI